MLSRNSLIINFITIYFCTGDWSELHHHNRLRHNVSSLKIIIFIYYYDLFKTSCADSSAHRYCLAPFEDPKHFFYTAQGLLLCAKYFSATHLLGDRNKYCLNK